MGTRGERGGLPSGTVTFLFTDIEGSTRLWAADRSTMSASLEVHDKLLRGAIEAVGGYVFSTAGDSFAAAFHRASDAVATALSAMAELAETSWPGPVLRVRMGLHLGEADERNGDYFGPAVNTAARVAAAGHGGQILLTEAVRAAAEIAAVDMGVHQLRDVAEPIHLYQLGEGVFPALRVVDAKSSNLPIHPTRLIGRDGELMHIRELLTSERLVTVTAIGGSGKTRLAVAVGEEELLARPAGVWFVDLRAVTADNDAPIPFALHRFGGAARTSANASEGGQFVGARTGDQFLKGLRARQREVWLGRERVDDVTEHPALAGAARALADIFDRQHQFAEDCLMPDPETGEPINVSHMIPRSKEDLKRRHRALVRISEGTVGLMGRTPDYMNVTYAGFAGERRRWAGEDGRNEEGAENLARYQKFLAREDISLTHTIVHPTVDKMRDDTFPNPVRLHKVAETEHGIVVRGSRILSTLAPFADELAVYPGHPLPDQEGVEPFAVSFCIPMDTPGLIFLCRDSASMTGVDLFDHPLSPRYDEQDAFIIFDNVEVPRDRIHINGHVGVYNSVMLPGAWWPNIMQQTTLRALTKLEFAYGLALGMAEAVNDQSPQTVDMLGELWGYVEITRNAVLLAEEHAYDWGDGVWFPDARPLHPMRAQLAKWFPRVNDILITIGSHNLLAAPSRGMLNDSRLRPLIDEFLHGANDVTAEERAAIFRLVWDHVGSSLGARNDLYERNYLASAKTNHAMCHVLYAGATKERARGLVDGILAAARAHLHRSDVS